MNQEIVSTEKQDQDHGTKFVEPLALISPPPRREYILHSNHLVLAIWKDVGLYYLFDPNGKDSEGNFFGRDLWSAKIVNNEEYNSPRNSPIYRNFLFCLINA